MARPFPTTFEDQSPMTPSSATSTNTPISYKADVNRAKTKKWAEAKPVSYGGDDWGDDDEYDLPPPPISKPTGFRQQGQATYGGQKPESPIVGNKKNYGDLPALPSAADSSSTRPRANSFDRDDEKRNFSSQSSNQPVPAVAPAPGPATRFSQITGQPSTRDPSGPPALSISTQLPAHQAVTGLRKASAVSPSSGSPHPDIVKPGRTASGDSSAIISPVSAETRTSSIDYQARRDYSPSAAPPPLHTRASPAPQSATDSPSTRFPPRKTSLSQSTGPNIAEITRKPTQETATSKPWVAERSSSPGATPRSPATQGKALPFIRPADIYKRVEEEKERERQSMDSSRPSMDSIVGARASDRSDSPAGKPQLDDEPESAPLRPMLEPVKERKSEYGFEGFNSSQHAPSHSIDSERSALEIEEERRQSVSPKLPDLNRVSGFGMDLFSPKQPEVPPPQAKDIMPVASSLADSQRTNDPGFQSVVNQAFNRRDDSSVPDTPTSRTNSEIRRTDSESTGTTGISPIMSRGPSSAVNNRDASVPSILEVSESSFVPEKEKPEAILPTFKSGHENNISNPSAGSSPARTPDLANATPVQSSQKVVIADPSSASSTATEEDGQLQPPRPIAEREQSFRPNLPGGWTSYATTTQSETPQEGPGAADTERTPIQSLETPSMHNKDDEDELDVTPTTEKHSPLQSALGAAVAGTAITGVGAAALAEHENETPAVETAPAQSLVVEEPRHFSGNNDYPTADHAMAPGESHLGPDTFNREISANSIDAPSPPARDTPAVATEDTSGYFPNPTVPLKKKSLRHEESYENLKLPSQPQVLPTPSTYDQPQDEESDQLRKEIIRSLSPRSSDAGRHDESLLSDQLDDPSNPSRISSYLPSEYDNYWATTAEEEQPAAVVTAPATTVPEEHTQRQIPSSIVISSPSHREHETSIQPLNPNGSQQSLGASRPSMHPQRFSWEASTEDVSVVPTEKEPEISSAEPHQFTGNELASNNEPQPNVPETSKPLQNEALDSHPATRNSEEEHQGRDAAFIAGGVALGSAAAAATYSYSPQPQEQPERRLSLAEEKVPQISSYPISPTLPEDQRPTRSSDAYLSPTTEHPSDPSAPSGPSAPSVPSFPSAPPSSVSPVNSPIQPQFTQTSRILAFKEIATMKSPEDRIKTFDETRQRFASMDSGLINWMLQLKAQHAEHADVTASFRGAGMSMPNGSMRGKSFGKGLGGNAPPLQQPYYQQYLNASSPTSGGPVSRPGPSTPVGSQQGFSPANKITTQQVQAKGKEFLHTASIFGGKAGKAGKGLLAKSKNKLRGGGDKTSSSPPAKQTKNDRRTSWGLPLTLSRSSGRPESSQNSVENTSVPVQPSMQHPMQPRQRAATLTLDTSSPPVRSQMTAGTDDNFIMSAPGILDNLGHMSGALPPVDTHGEPKSQSTVPHEVEQEAPAANQTNGRDYLNIPAPIGKNQPSWDPFNATPIAEEEGYQFDDRPAHQTHPMSPVPEAVSPPVDTPVKTFASNTESSKVQDTPEQISDLSDWVMVPQDPGPREPQQEQNPVDVVPTKPGPEPIKASSIPSPSMIDRPRGNSDLDKVAGKNNLSVENRPRGESSTSILDRPRYSYDVPRQVEAISPPISPLISPPKAPPPQVQPRTIQSEDRPRYSYEVPRQAAAMPPPFPQAQAPAKTIPPEYHPPPVNTTVQQVKTQQMEEDPQTATSFKGLPPIRRTSTFGLGFGPRRPKDRFPIDDEEESTPIAHQEPDVTSYGAGFAPAGYQNIPPATGDDGRQVQQGVPLQAQYPPPQTQYLPQQSQLPPPEPPFSERPTMVHAGSSEQSQRTIGQPQPQQMYNAPRASDFPPVVEGLRRSQDAWRPNAATSLAKSPDATPTMGNAATIPPQRGTSIEQQRNRAPSFTQQPDIIYNERMGRTVLNQPPKPFEQPPSSAQRYPELFRPEQPDFEGPRDGGDLPAHYYQAPIPREAAFLPRQQTNEYQLPGVGPPAEPPQSGSRRNSGLFKELGSRIRSASRERTHSISRDGDPQSPGRYNAQGNEYAESSVTSEEGREQKKRRNSFFGINRASTVGTGPPQSRESMVAHHPGSRTDLLMSNQPSPIASPHDRKRSFFGSIPSESKSKLNKLSRASTSGTAGMSEEPGKKKRFSGLNSVFARTSKEPSSSRGSVASDRPQATRELSHHERQPIESPVPDLRQFPRETPPPLQNQRGSSQQRSFLTKMTAGSESKTQKEIKPQKPAEKSGGFLSGIMGRRSHQPEKREDSSSQGTRSQGSQLQYHPNQLPPARTYSDLQEHPTPAQPKAHFVPPPWQRPYPPQQSQQQGAPVQPQVQTPVQQIQQTQKNQGPQPGDERGRRPSREPRYDSVPIPGGYSLVRGVGSIPVPTEYDPRGLASMQQPDPRYEQGVFQAAAPLPGGPLRYGNAQKSTPSPQPDHRASENRPPNLGPVESFEQYQQSSRRLSREDLLARSPAREPQGQQRPYQLSLPEDDEDRNAHPRSLDKDIPIISPPSSIRAPSSIQTTPNKPAQHSSIQRLVQPSLRHPQSPAGYPLPDDTVFSPINPSAHNLPPPPPPKWPAHLDNQDHHHLNLNADLNRSNTRHTAVSGISQLSNNGGQGHLAPHGGLDKEMGLSGREGITPSPTPPSPGITPPPPQSHVPHIHTTTLNRGPSPDLYNASPRLPKLGTGLGNEHSNGQQGGYFQGQPVARREPDAQEEKIYYNKDGNGDTDEEEPGPAAMSATSYPGQEWNPYAGVIGYEED